MRTSDRLLTPAVLLSLAFLAPPVAAFEPASPEAKLAAPSAALSALPKGGGLGARGEGGLQEIWRGYSRSYKSGDKLSALRQLEAASEQGDILAQWKLGRMFADGDGVPQDDYKAFLLFSRIADARGDESRDSLHAGVVANAFVALGAYWLDGIAQSPVRPNTAHAAKAFSYAATYYGHPEAQFQLARMLMDGSATGRPDQRVALRWLNLAAEKGHARAQALLGRTLLQGEATQRQPLRGLMWLEIARGNAGTGHDAWIADLHRKAFEAASEDERRQALAQAERFMRSAERR